MQKFKKGFTILELLVVIGIIGLLAAIILASLGTSRTKSRDAQRISDIKQIQIALDLYAGANNNAYPGSNQFYGSSGVTPILVTAGYLPKMPMDPTGKWYNYKGVGTGNGTTCIGYRLGASLESGSPVLDTDADSAVPGGTGSNCLGAGSGGLNQNGPAGSTPVTVSFFSGADTSYCSSGNSLTDVTEGVSCYDVSR